MYVQAFPKVGARLQISTAGGDGPAWRLDGRELFYVAGNRLMAVPITLTDTDSGAGMPVPLFSMPVGATFVTSPDGQRFLISRVVEEAAPITVLLNWKPTR
jgi:hypothetical protein